MSSVTLESQAGSGRKFFDKRSLLGLAGAVAVGVLIANLPAPEGLSVKGLRALGLLAFCAIIWIGGFLQVGASAVLIMALIPVLNLAPSKEVMAQLANDTNFLCIGGFIIAGSMSIYKLDKRIAISVTRAIGASIPKVLLGIMVSCTFLSMWMSNVVALLCVLPVVLGVFNALDIKEGDVVAKLFLFGLLMAAVLGGMATIVGTPPNALAVQLFAENGITVTFTQWFIVGTPIAWGSMLLTWLFMTKGILKMPFADDPKLRKYIDDEYVALGKMSLGEKLSAFSLIWFIAILIFRVQIASVIGPTFFTNGIAAIIPAAFLFIVGAMTWKEASTAISWQTLMFFATGLALSKAIQSSGAAVWMAQEVATLFPPALIPFAFVLIGGLLTQFSSNTAIAAIFLPIAYATSVSAGVDPLITCVSLCLACSLGYLTPVGTPIGIIILGQQVNGKTYIEEPIEYLKYNIVPFIICFGITMVYCITLVPILLY